MIRTSYPRIPYGQNAFEATDTPLSAIHETEQVEECGWCYLPTTNRCPHCRKHYCNRSCASKALHHLFKCGGRELTTADYLLRAVLDDEIPDDPQTVDDYMFSRCRTWSEKSHLFGLYGGMLKCNISSKQLDDWKRSGTLVSEIVSYYMAIPEGCRGGYFSWFQKHKSFLEGSYAEDPDDSQGETLFLTAISKAMVFLQPEDQKRFLRLEPIEKQHAFLFFAIAHENMHPTPTDDRWYNFGFCACRDEREERRLGG